MKSLLPLVIILLGCSAHRPMEPAEIAAAIDPPEAQVEAEPEQAGEVPSEGEAEVDPCEVCIAGGGSWQPEIEECTRGCEVMDISCYTDSCPGACEDDCGFCFSLDECAAAGCQWYQSGEAMWCGQW